MRIKELKFTQMKIIDSRVNSRLLSSKIASEIKVNCNKNEHCHNNSNIGQLFQLPDTFVKKNIKNYRTYKKMQLFFSCTCSSPI